MSQKIKTNQLRAFIATAEQGSYRQAAALLKVTQPAISQSINMLEASVQKKLFNNEKNTLTLTPFGEGLLLRARAFLAHHDELADFMFQTSLTQIDSISIATQPSIAQQLLPTMIQQFMSIYPLAKIHVRDTTIYHVNQLVAEKKVDFAICTTHDTDKSFSIKPICEDEYGVVAHVDHAIFKADNLKWQDLSAYSVIQNSTWDPDDVAEFKALETIVQMQVSNMSSLVMLLENGQSITVLPQLAFPKKNANLKFAPLNAPKRFRQIGLIKKKQVKLSESSNNFYQFIYKNYAQ